MSDDLVIHEGLVIPAAEVQISFARSGGPGGQNVNKVETKVELRWAPARSSALCPEDRDRLLGRLAARLTSRGELLVTSSRTRDQLRNRRDALEKLAQTIRKALERPALRTPTRPSHRAVEARIQHKKRRSSAKQLRRRTALED